MLILSENIWRRIIHQPSYCDNTLVTWTATLLQPWWLSRCWRKSRLLKPTSELPHYLSRSHFLSFATDWIHVSFFDMVSWIPVSLYLLLYHSDPLASQTFEYLLSFFLGLFSLHTMFDALSSQKHWNPFSQIYWLNWNTKSRRHVSLLLYFIFQQLFTFFSMVFILNIAFCDNKLFRVFSSYSHCLSYKLRCMLLCHKLHLLLRICLRSLFLLFLLGDFSTFPTGF